MTHPYRVESNWIRTGSPISPWFPHSCAGYWGNHLELQPLLAQGILLGGSSIPQALLTSDALELVTPSGAHMAAPELASQIATMQGDEAGLTLSSSGKPLDHTDVLIDEQGEILVKGENHWLSGTGMREICYRSQIRVAGIIPETPATSMSTDTSTRPIGQHVHLRRREHSA